MPKENEYLFRGKKLEFAPTDKVIKYYDEMKDLVSFVFGNDIDEIFVSNCSSFYHFLGVMDDVKTIPEVVIKIKKCYCVDVTEVQDEPLVDVIAFMLQKDNFCFT